MADEKSAQTEDTIEGKANATQARPEPGREECFATYGAAHGHAPLTKGEVLALLDQRGIAYEAVEHPAVRTVGEAEAAHIPFEADMAKNFFLRDPKKRNYYLFTAPDHKHVDLRVLQERLGSKRLSFASAEDLTAKLGVWPGSVTPFAALNEDTHTVRVALDADFARTGWIGCHPCDNTVSVHLRTSDLLALLADAGVEVELIEL